MAKKILLAEDSVTMQRIVEMTFAAEDFTVTAVSTIDEALARAREMSPDIVLADLSMPGKNGYDLCSALKREQVGTPVLLLHGAGAAFDDAKARAVGADGELAKPFETQALIDKVRNLTVARASRQPMGPVESLSSPIAAEDIVIETVPSAARPAPAAAPHPAAARPAGAVPRGTAPISSVPSRPSMPAPAPAPSAAPPAPALGRTPTAPSTPLAAPARPVTPLRPAAASSPGAPPPAARPIPSAPPAAAHTARPSAPVSPRPPSSPVAAPYSRPAPSAGPMPGGRPAAPPPMASASAGAAEMEIEIDAEPPPPMPAESLPDFTSPSTGARAGAVIEATREARPGRTLMGVRGELPAPPSGMPLPHATPAAQRPAPAAPVTAVERRGDIDPAVYEAVVKLSKEVIERIVWEVVPDLAESIIRQELDRLIEKRAK
ncbi:MAG: response regulator [Deltaproteobacteria bacterium]|nr:response regulator [Deltaproteobacteria bacterium]